MIPRSSLVHTYYNIVKKYLQTSLIPTMSMNAIADSIREQIRTEIQYTAHDAIHDRDEDEVIIFENAADKVRHAEHEIHI